MTVLGILLGVVVVLLITALTGYFVAQEFAYMAVDRSRLAARAAGGDSASARALAVTKRTSFMLSGAQLGITVTGLLVGYVAEPLVGAGLGTLLGGVGVPTAVGVAVGTILAVMFSTVVQMVFGELFPKNLAIARPEPVARRLALSTTLYLKVFGWLITLFDAASNALLRILRIEPVHDVEHSATPRDLEHLVAESHEAGDLPPHLSTVLDRILDFRTQTAEHAMIPRARVDVVRASAPVAEVLATMARGHTRYPVVGESSDDLRGVVELHDLLGDVDPAATAASVARPPVVVPTSLPLPDVRARLIEAEQEMAFVIDEYGGLAGIVTAEDMAEELVGEIADEHDPDGEVALLSPSDGGWTVGGGAHLDEIERAIGHDLPSGDYETLAGLLIAQAGGLPAVGEVVTVPLDGDPLDDDGPERAVRAEVREIERHVPSVAFLTVVDVSDDSSAGESAHETVDREEGDRG